MSISTASVNSDFSGYNNQEYQRGSYSNLELKLQAITKTVFLSTSLAKKAFLTSYIKKVKHEFEPIIRGGVR